METKQCFKCGCTKSLLEFYKHKGMKDGHIGKCKECAKNDVKASYAENIKNPEYIKKERKRGREKYERLNYRLRAQYKKPYTSKVMNVSRYINSQGFNTVNREIHHWNYLRLYDVFVLNKRAHKLVHKEITYDEDNNCFITDNGCLLNTKKLHFEYMINVFKKNNVNYEIDSISIQKL